MKITLDLNAKEPYRAHTFDGGADLCALDGGLLWICSSTSDAMRRKRDGN